jgi:uncharacterized membrane protein YkvA (DUF1232 family)
MSTRVGSWLAKPSLLRTLLEEARLAVRLIRDPAVPALIKGIPVLAGVYLISPIDALPDLVPVVGQLDDIGVALLALGLFLKLCPPVLVTHHRAAMAAGRRYSPMRAAASATSRQQPPDIDAEFRRE